MPLSWLVGQLVALLGAPPPRQSQADPPHPAPRSTRPQQAGSKTDLDDSSSIYLEGFLSHGGTPVHHPFLFGIFHCKPCKPFILGIPHLWKPPFHPCHLYHDNHTGMATGHQATAHIRASTTSVLTCASTNDRPPCAPNTPYTYRFCKYWTSNDQGHPLSLHFPTCTAAGMANFRTTAPLDAPILLVISEYLGTDDSQLIISRE